MKTFASRLGHFTLSVDLINKDNFNSIMGIIHRFAEAALAVKSVSVLIARPGFEGAGGLVRDDGKIFLQNKKNDHYTDIRALSFEEQIPLWIVSKNREHLSQGNDLQDLWSDIDNLPPYKDPPELEGKTKLSIVIPLKKSHDKIFGVISFDSIQHEVITERAKKEFESITDSVSKLYRISEYYNNQRERTNMAIQQFENSVVDEKLHDILKKPNIFLASSGAAKDDVISTIKEVMQEYSEKIALVYWKDINEAGNINEQILKAISECKYGICYFSEDDSQGSFCDNYNVIFEAGMMQALTNTKIENAPEAWIPIREKTSQKIPFDFAAERILFVPRDNEKKLVHESFRNQLRNRIEAL